MADSIFDPQEFLNSETEAGFDTTITQASPGEYTGMIDRVNVRSFNGNEGQTFVVMDLVWAIQDQEAKDETGLSKPTVRQSIFLDVENGTLARGRNKNVQLGKLLDALGLNTGKSWSPEGLVNMMAKIKAEHKENTADPANPFLNVVSVAAL